MAHDIQFVPLYGIIFVSMKWSVHALKRNHEGRSHRQPKWKVKQCNNHQAVIIICSLLTASILKKRRSVGRPSFGCTAPSSFFCCLVWRVVNKVSVDVNDELHKFYRMDDLLVRMVSMF
jgi:hypothetical protein